MNISENKIIQVKNLSASYGSNILFSDLNFTLKQGSYTALCGKNGAGKSTLLSLLDGIVPEGLNVTGQILIDGQDVFKLKRQVIAKKVSYLVQNENPVWNLRVKDFIETGLYAFNRLDKLSCDKLIDEAAKVLNIENLLEKNIFNISGGEFQKCRLARCLVQKSEVLLFDEPSENLDLPFQAQLLHLMKNLTQANSQNENGKTVLFSIHDINTAALFADDFLLFTEDKIIQGSVEEIFNEELLYKAYGKKVQVYIHPLKNRPQLTF